MRTRQRSMRPIRQPGHRALQIPVHPTMQRRPRHPVPGGDLDHTLPGQDRPDRVQPLLNHRQDNQRHPGPLIRNDAPTEASTVQDRRIRPGLSHINWRIAVAHHPAQDSRGHHPLLNPALCWIKDFASLSPARSACPRSIRAASRGRAPIMRRQRVVACIHCGGVAQAPAARISPRRGAATPMLAAQAR